MFSSSSFAKSRSPSRGEHSHHQPLVPCLVDANHPRHHVRRPSLPLPPRPDAVTVPLRPCCAECFSVTEESVNGGGDWQEKFTRGARRRRNSSADTHAHYHAQRHRTLRDNLPGFGAVVSVDEVDQRHGISRTAATPAPLPIEDGEGEGGLLPSFSRRLQISEVPTSAIEEEDEEGFPLPSPRRTPHDTPSASSSHLPQTAHGNMSSILLQALNDASCLAHTHSDEAGYYEPDDETSHARETIYYTPDTSPIMPSLEPSSFAFSRSPTELDSAPVTPALSSPVPPSSAPMLILGATQNSKTFFSNLSLSSFEIVHSPEPDSPPHARTSSHYDGQSFSTASPELTDYVPALTSASPSRKRLLRIPDLPGPGSFLRVGADIFKGVSILASGPGMSPMA